MSEGEPIELDYEQLLSRATEIIRERFRGGPLARIDPELLRQVLEAGPPLKPVSDIHTKSEMCDRTIRTTITVTGLSAYLLRLADERAERDEEP